MPAEIWSDLYTPFFQQFFEPRFKTDQIAQRLGVVQCKLEWTFGFVEAVQLNSAFCFEVLEGSNAGDGIGSCSETDVPNDKRLSFTTSLDESLLIDMQYVGFLSRADARMKRLTRLK